jgi:hypothetical protein
MRELLVLQHASHLAPPDIVGVDPVLKDQLRLGFSVEGRRNELSGITFLPESQQKNRETCAVVERRYYVCSRFSLPPPLLLSFAKVFRCKHAEFL